jgi:Pyridoxamine 5'-phosphate oxidase
MTGAEPNEPVAELPYMPGFDLDASLLWPWSRAEQTLESARTYWLSSVRPDGRPHVAPVWCVWLGNTMYFSTGSESRKAKNLEAGGHCAVSVEAGSTHVVVEGHARRVMDEATLRMMTEAYARKYDWPLQVREGAVFDAEGNGGPVYAVVPSVIFGFGEEATFTATRWRFRGTGTRN